MPFSIASPEVFGGFGIVATAAFCTFAFVPVANRLAIRIGAIDRPDHRKLHPQPTPRLGGGAMVFGASIGLGVVHLLLAPQPLAPIALSSELALAWVLPAVLLVFLLGVVDDTWGVSVGGKFLLEGLAAALVLIGCGAVQVLNLPLAGEVPLGGFGYVVSFLWLVGITNAFNLLDGLDGLAAGVGSLIAACIAALAFLKGDAGAAWVAAAVAGACLGLLPRNWAPASVFMGDCGSLTMGFVLAVVTHQSSIKAASTVAVLVPVLALGLPAIDTLLVMGFRFLSSSERGFVRRVLRMFAPDRFHLHHLVAHLTARRATVVILYILVALFCLAAFIVTLTNSVSLAVALLVAGALVVQILRRAGFRARARSLARGHRQRARALLRTGGFEARTLPAATGQPLHPASPDSAPPTAPTEGSLAAASPRGTAGASAQPRKGEHAMNSIPEAGSRIFVTGHRGLVGSAIHRRLEGEGFQHIQTATREQLDLRDQAAVNYWFKANRPEYVFLVAGTVGGILANSSRPAEFIYDNLLIHATVVHAAHLFGVKRLLYLGSSCIYPREAPQPMTEEHLLTGPLEPTNEPYAVAKIAGIKLCQAYRKQYDCDFISAMPTNLYGPNDNFDLASAHVLPALIRRCHEARVSGAPEVTVWGTGSPKRELLYVDDLADACLFLMRHYDRGRHINVGTGRDLSIKELAEAVRDVVAPGVDLAWDTSKPDGAPRKLLDVSRLHALGWRHTIELEEGIERTYAWFREHHDSAVAGQRAHGAGAPSPLSASTG